MWEGLAYRKGGGIQGGREGVRGESTEEAKEEKRKGRGGKKSSLMNISSLHDGWSLDGGWREGGSWCDFGVIFGSDKIKISHPVVSGIRSLTTHPAARTRRK